MAYDYYDRAKKLQLMKQKGDCPIAEFDNYSLKSSNTIFVMGSGYSINSISEKGWKVIEQNDSFGFNTWILHPHIPTYYGLEVPLFEDYFNAIINRFNEKKDLYRETPLFIQYQHFLKTVYSLEKLQLANEKIYYFAPYTFHTTNKKLLQKAISNFLDQKNPNLGNVIHYAGSLSYVIMMSYIMGYKEIVLMGIDLNDPRYWFMKDGIDKQAKAFAEMHQKYTNITGRSKQGGKHATIDRKFTSLYGSLPIDEYLKILKKELNKRGVKLYIGNEKSKLFPLLPLYEF